MSKTRKNEKKIKNIHKKMMKELEQNTWQSNYIHGENKEKKENKNAQNIWTELDQRSPEKSKNQWGKWAKSKLTINQQKSRITDQEHTTDINEWDQSKENERGMRLEREDHVLSNRMIRTWHA